MPRAKIALQPGKQERNSISKIKKEKEICHNTVGRSHDIKFYHLGAKSKYMAQYMMYAGLRQKRRITAVEWWAQQHITVPAWAKPNPQRRVTSPVYWV